ncbi:MAG TPA: cytidine deaminase [Acidimicrobiales bacterium]
MTTGENRKLVTQRKVYCEGVNPGPEIAWERLRAGAREAATRAYAPYSRVSVGACALTDSGEVVVGSNVENASYGLTLCAECSLVSDLVRVGGGRLIAASIVAGDGEPIAPCGRCRQLLFEHGGNELLIDAGENVVPTRLAALLPAAFGPDDLDVRRSS